MLGRPPPRLFGLALVFAILPLVPLPAGAQPAEAASELARTVEAHYAVRPDDGLIDVRFDYSFVNESVGLSFPGFFESLPVGADDVSVSSSRGTLEAAPIAIDGETATWFVAFTRPLGPGATATVELTWTIVDAGTPGRLAGPGAVSFDAYRPGGAGSPDRGTLTIEVPAGYESVEGHALVPDDGRGTSRLERRTTAYDVDRYQFVDVERFDGELVDLPPLAAVSGWPSDRAWVTAVTDRMTAVAAELDTWFGPRTEPFAVQRTLPTSDHPSVDATAVQLVGDDAVAVDHQLAHVWLADVRVDEPWFLEGLALGFAGERGPAGSAETMIAELVDQLGAAGVRAVIDELRTEHSPYPGPVPEARLLPPDWRTLVDLIERVGGVDAAGTFRAVIGDDGTARFDTELLDRRAAAMVDYTALEARAGAWALPPGVRHAMASWDFDTFTARQGDVNELIVARDEIDAWAVSLELTPRDDARVLFESAEGDLAEIRELLDDQRESLEAFGEAERVVNGDRGLLAAIGLWGSDPDGELADLRTLWDDGHDERLVHDAHELAESVENAVGRGTIRLLVPALVVIAAWQLLRWLGRRRAGGGSAELDEQGVEARGGDGQGANVSA